MSPSIEARIIALGGAAALATAMGIGRFALTPALPVMVSEGLTLSEGSLLATANYAGYLTGAILCALMPRLSMWESLQGLRNQALLVRVGLVGICMLTICMAVPSVAVWLVTRFMAGLMGAFVLIYTAALCLQRLAALGAPALGGVVFAGPGFGVVVSGLTASLMIQLEASGAVIWMSFALLAVLMARFAWPAFNRSPIPLASNVSGAREALDHSRIEILVFVFLYGLAGFGYIITATFLPLIARAVMPGSGWVDVFWPIIGCAVTAAALISSRLRYWHDMRHMLCACYLCQATGILVSIHWTTPIGFAIGCVLLGLPITLITLFAMHDVRRIAPNSVASTMAVATVSYGIGQMAGPPVAAEYVAHATDLSAGFVGALSIAAAVLVAGSVGFGLLSICFPVRDHARQ